MTIVIAILISIMIEILIIIFINHYFNNEKNRKKVLNDKNLFLSKNKNNLRIAIGVCLYLFIMLAFADDKHYVLWNILSATILIYSVSDINRKINAISMEDETINANKL